MKKILGFSYIELVISFMVLMVLGAIAYPAYMNYKNRSYFNSIVQVATSIEENINNCFKTTKKLSACNAGSNSIPANLTKPKGPIASITIKAGVIIVVPVPHGAITANNTYVLTPVADKDKLVWTTSGGAVADGFAD